MGYTLQQSRFAATVIAMTVIALVTLSLRIYIRTSVVRNFGNDDAVIICAMISTIVMAAMMIAQVEHGLGRHVKDVSIPEQVIIYRFFWVSVIFYNLAVGLVKISILLQYMRIFAPIKGMQLACRIVMLCAALFTIEATMISIFDCTPISYFWDKSIPGGHCVNFGAMWFTHASVNITFDVVLIILPIPVIKSLNLPTKQKIALVGIFAIGAFACVTSILRLHSIYLISYSNDVTYDNVGAALWSCVEIDTAIICASLPPFKAVVSRLFPRLLGKTLSGTTGSRSMFGSRHLDGPVTGQHGFVMMNSGAQDSGDAERLELRKYGDVRTNCEKEITISDSSDEHPDEEDGIKVVTVVSQRHERSSGDNDTHHEAWQYPDTRLRVQGSGG